MNIQHINSLTIDSHVQGENVPSTLHPICHRPDNESTYTFYHQYPAPGIDTAVGRFMFVCLKRVDVSMVVMCYARVIILYYIYDRSIYDRRRTELSNAPIHMKQDATSIEKKTD